MEADGIPVGVAQPESLRAEKECRVGAVLNLWGRTEYRLASPRESLRAKRNVGSAAVLNLWERTEYRSASPRESLRTERECRVGGGA